MCSIYRERNNNQILGVKGLSECLVQVKYNTNPLLGLTQRWLQLYNRGDCSIKVNITVIKVKQIHNLDHWLLYRVWLDTGLTYPIPNSPNNCKICMANNKRNYWWDLGSERVISAGKWRKVHMSAQLLIKSLTNIQWTTHKSLFPKLQNYMLNNRSQCKALRHLWVYS